jgi:multiple sugar transport system permease protein
MLDNNIYKTKGSLKIPKIPLIKKSETSSLNRVLQSAANVGIQGTNGITRGINWLINSQSMKGWIALIPALVFLILFVIYPLINSFILSFVVNLTQTTTGSSFVLVQFFNQNAHLCGDFYEPGCVTEKATFSFQNYIRLFEKESILNVDGHLAPESFVSSLLNTGLLVIVSVPLTIVIGLLVAIALYSIKPLQGFFQTVFFLPYVTNTIALGVVFNILFNDKPGSFANWVIGLFGHAPIDWLGTTAAYTSIFWVLIIYSVWNGIAFKILVFMSGLASIDKQYYDAAKIDGAKKGTILGRITVPLLSPQILYIVITSCIGAFKSYSSVVAVIGKGAYNFGPENKWITAVGYVYKNFNEGGHKYGDAAAASFVLFAIILVITFVQMRVSKSRVHY